MITIKMLNKKKSIIKKSGTKIYEEAMSKKLPKFLKPKMGPLRRILILITIKITMVGDDS